MTNIELIRQEIERLMNNNHTGTQEWIDAKECAYMQILSFIDSLPKETPQGWISAKDRLPENDNDVIACNNHNGTPQYVGTSHYKDGKWLDDFSWDNYERYFGPVDYWMPIPKFKEE